MSTNDPTLATDAAKSTTSSANLSRRQAMAVLAALSTSTAPSGLSGSLRHDPLVSAIDAYWKAVDDYSRHPICKAVDVTEVQSEAACAETYGPPLEVLENWDRPAINLQGAVAALRFVVREGRDGFSASAAVTAMIQAALGYLESEHDR